MSKETHILCQKTHEYVEIVKVEKETRGVSPVFKKDIYCVKRDVNFLETDMNMWTLWN